MLVTFTCPAYSDITMFGDAALRLLTRMGHSATVPGALLAEDVPAALHRLQAAVQSDEQSADGEENPALESDERTVSLRHRALPLIELLEAAAKEECNVMWDSNT